MAVLHDIPNRGHAIATRAGLSVSLIADLICTVNYGLGEVDPAYGYNSAGDRFTTI